MLSFVVRFVAFIGEAFIGEALAGVVLTGKDFTTGVSGALI
jgi:hypothetical protein